MPDLDLDRRASGVRVVFLCWYQRAGSVGIGPVRHGNFLWFVSSSARKTIQPPTFLDWREWIIVVGAFFFPLMALLSWLSMRNDWSAEKEDQTIMQTLGYIVLAPVLVVAVIIAGVALYSAFGWFATIPSWAAVIIFLLVLIYLKK